MSSLEQLLHDAMAEHTEGVRGPRPGAARDAVRHGTRVRRLQVTAVSGTAVAVVAVAGSVVSHVGSGPTVASPGGGGAATAAPAAAPSAAASKPTAAAAPMPSAAVASATVNPDGPKAKSGVGAPADLAGVSLSEPGARFPAATQP